MHYWAQTALVYGSGLFRLVMLFLEVTGYERIKVRAGGATLVISAGTSIK
jgi:hypothetical protein